MMTSANSRTVLIEGRSLRIAHDHDRPAGWTPNIVRELVVSPYAFPGGYEKVAVMDDGGVLCARCVAENYESVYKETRTPMGCGWSIAAVGLVEDLTDYGHEAMNCDHCGRDFCDIQD